MQQVAPGIYALEGLNTGRAYLIDDRDTLALIDTSTAPAADLILGAIDSIGRRREQLRTIVATHYHHDHTGNAEALRVLTGAQICAHAADVPYIDGRMSWLDPKGIFAPVARSESKRRYLTLEVDRSLNEGDTIDAAGGLEVLHAPGHTPGHIALYARERGVMFTGDAFMNVLGLRPPLAMSSHDMDAARASIRRLASFEFDVALPGHGHPILSRASEKLREWSRRWL